MQFVERDFAEKLKHWVYHGYEELGDTGGCGLGRTTASVLSHRQFLSDPHKVLVIQEVAKKMSPPTKSGLIRS